MVKQGVKRLEMGWWQNQVGEGAAVAVGVGIWVCQGEGVEVEVGEGVESSGTVLAWGSETALVGTGTGSLKLIGQALAGSVLNLGFVLLEWQV